MADKYVTVATFHLPYEAELAKNLLQNEGVESFLTGELTADIWLGNTGIGDQLRLQVHERDARRAAAVLAAQEAALDDDWEDKAEHDPDVWVCSLCGSPISNRLSVCHACQTPREGIRADRPRSLTDVQKAPDAPPPADPARKRDEVTAETPPPLAPAAPATAPAEGEANEDLPPEAPGDVLARSAFGAALVSAFFACLLPLAWYNLARLLAHSGELSPRGTRFYYAALTINGLLLLVWLTFGAAVLYYR